MIQPTDTIETVFVSPAEILLDPNSYRLVQDPLREPVPDDEIRDPEVQSQTFSAIVSDSHAGLRELRASLRQYGWLDIAPLWVRRLRDGSLVVVDGNRRLAAWRLIDVNPSPPQSPHSPAATDAPSILVHVATEYQTADASLRLALCHLQPPMSWPALGLAVWRDEFRDAHGEPPGRAGLAPHWRFRTDRLDLALKLARKFAGDWAPEARADQYALLLDALSLRQVASWLATEGGETDTARVARLLDWLAPQPRANEDEEDDIEPSGSEGRSFSGFRGLRQLATLLEDPDAVAKLDAGADPRDLLAEWHEPREVAGPGDYLHPTVATLLAKRRPLDPGRVQNALVRLREAARRANEEPVEPGTQHPWRLVADHRPAFLSSLRVHRYRGITDVVLEGLGRVNLVVGVNNAGKGPRNNKLHEPRASMCPRQWPGRTAGRAVVLPRFARAAGGGAAAAEFRKLLLSGP